MKNMLKGPGIATLMVLGLLVSAGAVMAVEQMVSGEVVRVGPGQKQVTLIVPDGSSAEGKQVTVLVDKHTRFQGVQNLSELKEGTSVKVEVKKTWYTRQWIAQRLIYAPPAEKQESQGMSSTDKAQLHDAENRFAQGQMGDVEFETKRQVLEK